MIMEKEANDTYEEHRANALLTDMIRTRQQRFFEILTWVINNGFSQKCYL